MVVKRPTEWKPNPIRPGRFTLTVLAIRARRILGLTLAALWRRLLFRTKIIAVTGSVGKTTAKDCIAAILSSKEHVESSPGSDNHFRGIAKTLLRTRPWHRYAVLEVAIDQPGQMKWFGRVVRPDVAVWLGTARTHTREYESLAHIASEKSRLVSALRRGGTAVLSSDDPYVRAYQAPGHARTVHFGCDASSHLRAQDIHAEWPRRLSFTVHQGDRNVQVQTQLVGTHWVPSVLAAIAVGLECGFSLEDAVRPLAEVQPYSARLSPLELPSGAVILRDENNGSVDTFDRAFDVLAGAQAKRKILVISDLSDANQRWQLRSRDIGAQAARCADVAVFFGDHARKTAANAVRSGMDPYKVFAFPFLQPGVEFLRQELRSGDLVLIKGRGVDKLGRVSLAMVRDVTCWKSTCTFVEQCDFCPQLNQPIQIAL